MESILKRELHKFWKWAEITPQEYATGKAPEKAVQAEWEGNYPGWQELTNAVEKEIQIYNQDLNEKRANLILEVLAIDNESELILEKLILKLNKEAQKHLSHVGLVFPMKQARWQIAELLEQVDVLDRENLLKNMIVNDTDKYVQRIALLSLSNIAPLLAEEYAFLKIKDEDEYLRLVSLRILKKQRSEKLNLAKVILQDDSSPLIQKELEE